MQMSVARVIIDVVYKSGYNITWPAAENRAAGHFTSQMK